MLIDVFSFAIRRNAQLPVGPRARTTPFPWTAAKFAAIS